MVPNPDVAAAAQARRGIVARRVHGGRDRRAARRTTRGRPRSRMQRRTTGGSRATRPAPRSGSSSWSWPSRSPRPSARSASAGVQALERTGLARASGRRSPRAHASHPSTGCSSRPTGSRPIRPTIRRTTSRRIRRPRGSATCSRPARARSGRSTSAPATASTRCSPRDTARHVVATDVNPRALAFTEVNAALSGLDNVECRRGSLFEPVDGERFDLIVCNAPYVVSPERRWTYRDGALEGDELSERVVRGAAAQLEEGGFANVCVTWLGGDPEVPDERVAEWVDGSGCDAWILPLNESSPVEYAERWNSHFVGRPCRVRRRARPLDVVPRATRRRRGDRGSRHPAPARRDRTQRGSTRSTRTSWTSRARRSGVPSPRARASTAPTCATLYSRRPTISASTRELEERPRRRRARRARGRNVAGARGEAPRGAELVAAARRQPDAPRPVGFARRRCRCAVSCSSWARSSWSASRREGAGRTRSAPGRRSLFGVSP